MYLLIKLLLIYMQALCFILDLCILTNAFVDKHHLSPQKKFEKTKTVTIIHYILTEQLTLPSAWIQKSKYMLSLAQ